MFANIWFISKSKIAQKLFPDGIALQKQLVREGSNIYLFKFTIHAFHNIDISEVR